MKSDGVRSELGELDRLTQHGYGFLANNAGKLVALVAALVAVIVTFADVMLTDLGGVRFTSTVAVMVVATYLVYFSLEDAGERYGEESEEYRRAMARYEAAREAILPEDVEPLRKFLVAYSRAQLRHTRERLLTDNGISYEAWQAYLKDGVAAGRERRILRRAHRMRVRTLTPAELLSPLAVRKSDDLRSPERGKRTRLFLGLLPATVCTFFTLSVAVELKHGMTAGAVLDSLFKLSTLPIMGFRGYISGFTHARGAMAEWLESKARLLESFAAGREREANEASEAKKD